MPTLTHQLVAIATPPATPPTDEAPIQTQTPAQASPQELAVGPTTTPEPQPAPAATTVPSPTLPRQAAPEPATSAATDREALVALYHSTSDPGWKDNENWLTDRPIGEWHGVGTDPSGQVIRLSLVANQLSGTIPPVLGNLTSLRELYLHDNNLFGELPRDLAKLDALIFLSLSGNSIEGVIPPEWGQFFSLVWLALDRNNLSGTIPPELANLSVLERLTLGYNNLSGTIPPELGKLATLKALRLEHNDLVGLMPPELADLSSLEVLALENNKLTGNVSPELVKATNLRKLGLAHNELSGTIPAAFANLPKLNNLTLSRNTDLCLPPDLKPRISTVYGPLCNSETDREALVALYHAAGGPNWTCNEGWLSHLPLAYWCGVYIGANGRVTDLDWNPYDRGYGNNLVGIIPPEMGNLAYLQSLELEGNELSGPVPAEMGNLSNLEELNLGHNRLTGELPLSFKGLTELRSLNFRGNQGLCAPVALQEWIQQVETLEGMICPEQLARTPGVVHDRGVLVDVFRATGGPGWRRSENWLTDRPLHEWERVYTDRNGHVVSLRLSQNNMTGRIPPELGSLPYLFRLSIVGSELTGPVPAELGNLSQLVELDLGYNQLTGELPQTLANVNGLTDLRTYGNDGLCIPVVLQEWIQPIWRLGGEICPDQLAKTPGVKADRAALERFYSATGGPNWRDWRRLAERPSVVQLGRSQD